MDDIRRLLRRALCWFRGGHDWDRSAQPFDDMDTTAPYPAVGETRQRQPCKNCGAARTVFVGFIFDKDAS